MTRKEGEGSSQETCIKDPWTKTESEGRVTVKGRGWAGQRVMRGKWGQLKLNNNKKKKRSKSENGLAADTPLFIPL